MRFAKGIFCVLAMAGVAAGAEPPTPQEVIGPPIDSGYFFYEFKFIPGPYVVKRTGLNIYINDILLHPEPKLPKVLQVDVDPGVPGPTDLYGYPPGPGRPIEENLYNKKWIYLRSHADYASAKAAMLETLKLAPNVKSAKYSDLPSENELVLIELTNGDISRLGLHPSSARDKPVSMETMLSFLEQKRQLYESMLQNGSFLNITSSFEHSLDSEDAKGAMVVLLSSLSAAEQWERLLELDVVLPNEPSMKRYIQEFPNREEMLKRLNGTKVAASKAGPENKVEAPAVVQPVPSVSPVKADAQKAPEQPDSPPNNTFPISLIIVGSVLLLALCFVAVRAHRKKD